MSGDVWWQCIVAEPGALPWFVDRPYRNITTPLAPHRTAQHQVSPTALSFLTRPVESVDHICRTVQPVYNMCTTLYRSCYQHQVSLVCHVNLEI